MSMADKARQTFSIAYGQNIQLLTIKVLLIRFSNYFFSLKVEILLISTPEAAAIQIG